jgi:hypothetical protein
MRTDEALARDVSPEEGGMLAPLDLAGDREAGMGSARSAPMANRLGKCYQLAGRFAMDHLDTTLRQATPRPRLGRNDRRGVRADHRQGVARRDLRRLLQSRQRTAIRSRRMATERRRNRTLGALGMSTQHGAWRAPPRKRQTRPMAVLDDDRRLIGWRDEPDAPPYAGTKTVRQLLRERGETP